MNVYQLALLILVTVGFIKGLQADIYGVKAREPSGRTGIVCTIIVNAAVVFCYWKAGALSTILP